MQKKKLNDHRFDVNYDPNRPISFPNNCHLGSQSILTWPVVKKSQHECNKGLYKIIVNRSIFTSLLHVLYAQENAVIG